MRRSATGDGGGTGAAAAASGRQRVRAALFAALVGGVGLGACGSDDAAATGGSGGTSGAASGGSSGAFDAGLEAAGGSGQSGGAGRSGAGGGAGTSAGDAAQDATGGSAPDAAGGSGWDSGPARANGEACCASEECGSGLCKTSFMELGRNLPMLDGTCVSYCSVSTDCASDEFCHQQTDDGAVVRGAYCLKTCSSDSDCRPGYHCGGWGDCFPGGYAASCGSEDDLESIATKEPDGSLRYVGCTAGRSTLLVGSCGGSGSERIFAYTPAQGGQLVVDTTGPGTGLDTVLYVRSSCAQALSEIACDDDGGGGTSSRLDIQVAAGVPLFLVVDGDPDYGRFELNVRLEPGVTCAAGKADCDGQAGNGCEAQLGSDPNNCAGCGFGCSGAHAIGACNGGACTITGCEQGFGNCDSHVGNGCEADFSSDGSNCGGCGTDCTFPQASASCQSGQCVFDGCTDSSYGNCDGNLANGCETSLRGNLTDCGACGQACARPNAVSACSTGYCFVASCLSGWDNCDGRDDNGCETDVSSDLVNCGACSKACSLPNATSVCSGSTCLPTGCSPGFGDCDAVASNGCETNTTSSAANCGGCNAPCPAGANGAPACTASTCGFACTAPYGDCDGVAANGCENDTRTDPLNCGACGNVCPARPNGSPACSGGTCTVVCDAGFGDCDVDPTDGCELNLLTDWRNCGTCNNACPYPPSTAYPNCNGGQCGYDCDYQYRDCDGLASNWCESNPLTDPLNCNTCGHACAGTQVCCNGACTRNCP